jgi:hypothetical protein
VKMLLAITVHRILGNTKGLFGARGSHSFHSTAGNTHAAAAEQRL